MDKKVLLLVIVFIIAYALGGWFNPRTVYFNHTQPQPIPITNVSLASINVPAIDENGNGVITSIIVQAAPGNGKTLTNIDKILFWIDTQGSIRTARSVAESVTGLNLSRYDIIYTITANATIIEGPSAGAALTIATITALENRTINPSIMMTGTINPDGTIGMAGSIKEKAEIAKNAGATTFLIPFGYLAETVGYERVRVCEEMNGIEYCETEYVPKMMGLSESLGIKIEEVKNIKEALEYF